MIKKLYLGNFGKFKDFTMDLTEGLTVIHGQNEDGKSTLMAFVLLMFYGHSGRIQDVTRNPRKKYRPWNGEEMHGYILFTHQGKDLRLERVFGDTQGKDTVKVLEMPSGEAVKLRHPKEPGQDFFGLGEEAFSRSVFIGQGGVLMGAGGKKDELTEKLLNLVTTGNEDMSYKKAEEELQKAAEFYVSKSKRLGLLVEAREALEGLKGEKSQAEVEEMDKESEAFNILELKTEREELRVEEERLRGRLAVLPLQEEWKKLLAAISREERLHGVEREKKDREDALTFQGRRLDEEFLREGEEKLQGLKDLEKDISRLYLELKSQEDLLITQVKEMPKEVRQEEVARLMKIQEEMGKMKEDLKVLEENIQRAEAYEERKDSLQKLQGAVAEAKGQKDQARADFHEAEEIFKKETEALKSLKIQEEEEEKALREVDFSIRSIHEKKTWQEGALKESRETHEKAVVEARKKLQEAKKPLEMEEVVPAKRSLKLPRLLAGLLLVGAFLGLGIVVDPLFYGGVFLGLMLIAWSFTKTKETTHRVTKVDEERVLERQDALERLLADAKDKEDAEEREKKALDLAYDKARAVYEEKEAAYKHWREKVVSQEAKVTVLEAAMKELSISKTRMETRYENLFQQYEHEEELLRKEEVPPRVEELLVKKERVEEESSALEKDFTEGLLAHQVDTLKDLTEKFQLYERAQEKKLEKEEEIKKRIELVKKHQVQYHALETSLMEFLAPLGEMGDKHGVQDVLESFAASLNTYERVKDQVAYLRSMREDLEKNHPMEELQERRENLEVKMKTLLQVEVLDEAQVEALAAEKETLEEVKKKGAKIGETIAAMESTLKEKYRQKKNVSQVVEEIHALEEKVSLLEEEHEALTLARTHLKASFDEIGRSFGPKVNGKTEEIFRVLTKGKYQRVAVDKEFHISVEDEKRKRIYEWGFLSSGTIDQAYLALRLAVADLVLQDGEPLPLFLDDVFTQYDDQRAEEGMQFLKDYVSKGAEPMQGIIFTCHERMYAFAKTLLGVQSVRLSS